jgi:hypothetical protein
VTSRLEGAVRRIRRDLDEVGARWAVIGGLAVSAHAEPRTYRRAISSVSPSSTHRS